MMLMASSAADTATAPRMRQYEHVQRRADPNPSVSVTVNCTLLQWQAPLTVSVTALIQSSWLRSCFLTAAVAHSRRSGAFLMALNPGLTIQVSGSSEVPPFHPVARPQRAIPHPSRRADRP